MNIFFLKKIKCNFIIKIIGNNADYIIPVYCFKKVFYMKILKNRLDFNKRIEKIFTDYWQFIYNQGG